MDEWEIPLVVKDHETGRVISVDGLLRANKVHKRLCLVLIVMAFVGGGLIEIGDASAPDGCEEGGTLVSIGVFLFWTSVLAVPINGLILLASIPVKIMSTVGVYLQAIFHIIMLVVVVAIFGEAINCHFPFTVAPNYNIGSGF